MITILWALVSLCVVVAVIYLIIWVLGQIGLTIPANVLKIVWVILVLLAIIFICQHFFSGGLDMGYRHVR